MWIIDGTCDVSFPSCCLHSIFRTFVLCDRGSVPLSPDFIWFLKLSRGSGCSPLLLQHNAAPIDAFYFLKHADGSISISVEDKKQHLIEDATVHRIYGLLNSTSATNTRTHTHAHMKQGRLFSRGSISQLLHFRQPTVRYEMKTLLLHQYNAIMGFREIAHAMKRSIFLSLAASLMQSQTQRRRLKSGALSQNTPHKQTLTVKDSMSFPVYSRTSQRGYDRHD